MFAGNMAAPSLTRMDSLEGNSNYFFTSIDQGLTLPPKICQNSGSEDTVDYFAEGEHAASPAPSWFEPDASSSPRTKRRMTPGTAVPESLPSPLQSFQSGIEVRTVTTDYHHCSSEVHCLRVQEENDDSVPTAPSMYNPSAYDDIQLDDWGSCDLFGDPQESPPSLSADGSGSNSRQSSLDFAISSDLHSSYARITGAGPDCTENEGVCLHKGLQEKDLAHPDKWLSVPNNGLSLPSTSLPSLSDISGSGATQQQQQPNISTSLGQVPQRLPSAHQLSQSIEPNEAEQAPTLSVQPSYKPNGKMPTKTFLRKRKREEPQDVTYKHSILLSLLTRLAGPALQASINAHIKKLRTDDIQHKVHPSLGPSFDIVRRKIQEDEIFRNEAIAYIMQLPEETDDELFGEYAVDSNFREQIKDLAPQDLRRMLVAKDKRIDTCTRKWQKYKSERDTAWTIINQQRNAEKWRREREEDSEEDSPLPRRSNSSPDTFQQDTSSAKRRSNSSLGDSPGQTSFKAERENPTYESSSVAIEAAQVVQDQERQDFEDMKALVGIKEARIKALELELERLKSQLVQQTRERDPDTSLNTTEPGLRSNCCQLQNSSQKLYSSPYVDTRQPFPCQYPNSTYLPDQSASKVHQSGLLSSDRRGLNHQSTTLRVLYDNGQGSTGPLVNQNSMNGFQSSPMNGTPQISPRFQAGSDTSTTSRQLSTASLPQILRADCQTSTASSLKRPFPAGQESTSATSLSPKRRCKEITRINDVAAYQLGGRRPAWMAQPSIAAPPSCHMAQVNLTPAVVDLTQDLAESCDEDGWDDFDNDLDKALQEREEERRAVSNHGDEQEDDWEQQEQDFSELERELELEMGRVPEEPTD